MSTPSVRISEYPISLRADKIVRRLDDFPELLQALRDGDLPTLRLIWAQLVDCDGQRNPTPTLPAAMKSH
jgi:hypothetical protein